MTPGAEGQRRNLELDGQAPQARPRAGPRRQGGGRPLVMMIEDDANDREIYGAMLCYNGFDVLLVPDIASAFRGLEAHTPDLVLLDLGLPDGSGFDACAALRRRPGLERTPVIMLSASPERDAAPRAAAVGCSLYFEKPTSPVGILHVIEQQIGRAPLPGVGAPPRLLTESASGAGRVERWT